MSTIEAIGQELTEAFDLFDDGMDKYEYLIDLGQQVPSLEEKEKTDDFLVEGCQSKVWLKAKMENGLVRFRADSNTVITKGIVAILVKALDGQTPTDILNNELKFIEEIGLHQLLSEQRSSGLKSMLKQMKLYALAFQEKKNIIT